MKFQKIFLILVFCVLGHPAYAELSCETDCKSRAKTRYACGVNISWSKVSTKMCDGTDWPAYWTCEGIRSTACKVNEIFQESGPEGTAVYTTDQIFKPYKPLGFGGTTTIVVNSEHEVADMKQTYDAIQMIPNVGGLVCEPELTADAKRGVTGVHWAQIPQEEYCRLRWRHLSNTINNGYQRSVKKASCNAWYTLHRTNNYFDHTPLTFRCKDYRHEIEEMRIRTIKETSAIYDAEKTEVEALANEFIANIQPENFAEFATAQGLDTEAVKEVTIRNANYSSLATGIQLEETKLSELQKEANAIERDTAAAIGQFDSFKIYYEEQRSLLERGLAEVDRSLASLYQDLEAATKLLDKVGGYNDSISNPLVENRLHLIDWKKIESNYGETKTNYYDKSCENNDLREKFKDVQRSQYMNQAIVDQIRGSFSLFEIPSRFKHLADELDKKILEIEKSVNTRDIVFSSNLVDSIMKEPEVCRSFKLTLPIFGALLELEHSRKIAQRLDSETRFLADNIRILEKRFASQRQVEILSEKVRSSYGKLELLLAEGKIGEAHAAFLDFVEDEKNSLSIFHAIEDKTDRASALGFYQSTAEKIKRRGETILNVRTAADILELRASTLFYRIEEIKSEADSLPNSEKSFFENNLLTLVKKQVDYREGDGIFQPKYSDITDVLKFDGGLTESEHLIASYEKWATSIRGQ